MVMPPEAIASGAVPVFVSVKLSGTLVVVMGTPPNGRLVADKVTTGAVAVPVRVTICALLLTALLLSVKVRVALRGPTGGNIATGVNVMVTAQLALTARGEEQVLVWIVKSLAFVPLIAPVALRPWKVSGQVPRLERVIVAAALVVPTCWLPNVTGEMVTLTSGAAASPPSPTVRMMGPLPMS